MNRADAPGAWLKTRLNRGHEFEIGSYITGSNSFDAIIFGYSQRGLHTPGGHATAFTPILRDQLQKRMQDLKISSCPFTNLPETRSSPWGLGLTAEKMKDYRLGKARSGRTV
jgi:bifunctional non-homologous end joining protein LigD